MRYVSTCGEAPPLGFMDVTLAGLARDGGLYVPETWPQLSLATIAGFAGQPYAEVAVEVILPFVGDTISRQDLSRLAREAYGTFRHPAVVPIAQFGASTFLLELFHGPTLAFKDVAMQLLARLMDHALTARGERTTIVVATSGAGNVHALAIEGTFDDCQAIVKGLFNHHQFRDAVALSGVNSINWARIVAQVVYYFTAAATLGAPHRKVAFTVPTGNFGDIFAGYVAARIAAEVSSSSARPASNSSRIAASIGPGSTKRPDCFNDSISRRTLAASRRLASNSSRSKFEEIWMSIEGEAVACTSRTS